MNEENTVAVRQSVTYEQMESMANNIATSGMFGIKTPSQAMVLMMLCQSEGLHPVMALRRYDIIDGRPAYRGDAMQGEFEKKGEILWHARNEKECAATFFRDKTKVDKAAIERAKKRYRRMKEGKDWDDLVAIGEITIVRTLQDAIEKKVAMRWNPELRPPTWDMKKNWRQSPRQMLHWRCLTEGVRAINPGLVAGVYTEDEILDMVDEPTIIEGETVPAETLVRTAVANATGEPDEPIEEAPADLGDLKCHIGKANGPVLGKKVREIDDEPLQWLHDKWTIKWGIATDPKDVRLKRAVDEELERRKVKPAEPVKDTTHANDTTGMAKAAPTGDFVAMLKDKDRTETKTKRKGSKSDEAK